MSGSESNEGQGRRILLVEDHKDSASVMSRLLERLQFQIQTAESLETARRMAESHRFDLLICDIQLPDGSGLDLMRELRSRYDIRGIALSGRGSEEDRQKGRDAGFDEHLTKPIDFQTLRTTVQELTA